jgi:hypothetical protein
VSRHAGGHGGPVSTEADTGQSDTRLREVGLGDTARGDAEPVRVVLAGAHGFGREYLKRLRGLTGTRRSKWRARRSPAR